MENLEKLTELKWFREINQLVSGVLMCLTLWTLVLHREQVRSVLKSCYGGLLSLCCKSQLSKLDQQAQDAFHMELAKLLVRASQGLVVLMFCRSILVVVGKDDWLVPAVHLPALLLYVSGLFVTNFHHLVNPSSLDAWHIFLFFVLLLPALIDENGFYTALQRSVFMRLLLSVTVKRGALSIIWNVVFFLTVRIRTNNAASVTPFSEMVMVLSVAFAVRHVLYRCVRMGVRLETSTVELSAVSRLLHGFCDAVVELDENMKLTDARQLSTILLHRTPSSPEGADFPSYFLGEDVQRVRDCLERPGQDLPPLALNAKMMDSMAGEVHVELLHVPFTNAERKECHYVGMREVQDVLSAVTPLPLRVSPSCATSCAHQRGEASIVFLGSSLQIVDADPNVSQLCKTHMGVSVLGLTLMDLDPSKGPQSLSGQVQYAMNGFVNGDSWAQEPIALKDLHLFGCQIVAMSIAQDSELMGSLILSEPSSSLTHRNLKRLNRGHGLQVASWSSRSEFSEPSQPRKAKSCL